MKKAIAWSFIINGLIIGIIVVGLFLSILGKVFYDNARQDAKHAYNEILVAGNNLCLAGMGDETYLELNYPDIVEGIYVSLDDDYFPDDFEDRIDKNVVDVGNKLCIKIREEEPYCTNLDCEVEMSNIGAQRTVLSLADKLVKKPNYQKTGLYFLRGECGSSILTADATAGSERNGCIVSRCDYTILMGCNKQAAAVLVDDKAVILSDTTPFCQGTRGCFVPKATVDFSTNVGEWFRGSNMNILFIWEDRNMDPNDDGFSGLIGNLTNAGFEVDNMRHDSTHPINDNIQDYDQIWIFRPGWCQGQNTDGTERSDSYDCEGVSAWSASEIEAISDYLEDGGSIMITSEYSNVDDENYKREMNIAQDVNYPQEAAANMILDVIEDGLYFDQTGCFCGCRTKSVTNYAQHSIMQGVTGFRFDAATRILCE